MNTEVLVNISLFDGLPASEMSHLASTLRVLDLQPGSPLFKENEIGNELFIVIAGHIEVVKGMGTPEEKILQTMVEWLCAVAIDAFFREVEQRIAPLDTEDQVRLRERLKLA